MPKVVEKLKRNCQAEICTTNCTNSDFFPEQVQAYIEKLKQHVEHLARQNNKLAGYHKKVQAKVIELMGTDLLRQQTKWKDQLKEIRQLMTQVEQDGFTAFLAALLA